ncbi:hypothetical protein NQZ68_008522 [Dissostichus eleginoides]|nr:hypothetical protein NQZ68_008522 [Dissostichus eleginoides]
MTSISGLVMGGVPAGVAVSWLKQPVRLSYQWSTVQFQPTASCLLPPREQGAGACVCGCLSFWQDTLPRETARSPRYFLLPFRGELFVYQRLGIFLLKPKDSLIVFGCIEAPRAADNTVDNQRKAPGNTTHEE